MVPPLRVGRNLINLVLRELWMTLFLAIRVRGYELGKRLITSMEKLVVWSLRLNSLTVLFTALDS
jgi:hypothetical protein